MGFSISNCLRNKCKFVMVYKSVSMGTVITNIGKLDLNGSYTYADYLLWDFKERVELIRGKVFKMSPAPSTSHQNILMNLTRALDKVFYKTDCKMFFAPFDVRLVDFRISTDDNQVITVVQPDLCVICDKSKVDEKGCLGSPDLMIEVLSPDNSKKGMDIKFDLYEENGVKEYWIVNPVSNNVAIYVMQNGKYIGLKPLIIGSKLESPTFPNLKFPVKKIFEVL
jgi:Uma2 family endonuclease